MKFYCFYCENVAKQQYLGKLIADNRYANHLVIFLQGGLGVGKTTFVQGIMQAAGYSDKVKSPTYSLIEFYQLPTQTILHADLYRLNHPKEVLALDLIAQIDLADLSCIEWPQKAENFLPPPDLICTIDFADVGRILNWQALSATGITVLQAMVASWSM